MNIERIVVSNYKIYQSLNFSIQNENNIFVGDNGSGKTTLLESIYLALTGRIDGQNAERLLTPDMFSNDIRAEYINQLKSTGKASLPKIIIEIYFKDDMLYRKEPRIRRILIVRELDLNAHLIHNMAKSTRIVWKLPMMKKQVFKC